MKLSKIWSAVLDLSEISIYDDLYDLGGDSILAIKISNLISEYMKVKIEVSDLFKYLTIAELAQYIDGIDRENKSLVNSIISVAAAHFSKGESPASSRVTLQSSEKEAASNSLSI